MFRLQFKFKYLCIYIINTFKVNSSKGLDGVSCLTCSTWRPVSRQELKVKNISTNIEQVAGVR